MKRYTIGLIVLFSILIASCNDSVDVKTTTSDSYIFYCIMNSDTTFHAAYLSKPYNVDGIDPYANTADPSIANANIVINFNNVNYTFRDTTVARTDTSRYTTPFHLYYNKKLNLMDDLVSSQSLPMTIKITLPNNKILTSSLETIPISDFHFSRMIYTFPPPTDSAFITFKWLFYSKASLIDKYYYLPFIQLHYSHKSGGVTTEKSINIPYRTVFSGVEDIEFYPTVSKKTLLSLNAQYIFDAFKKIYSADSVKSNFTIHSLTFKVILLEKNLAAYYAQSATYNDEFSVRIDAADFTNITGGYGLFGAYATKTIKLSLSKGWLSSQGYNYDF